jgi:hypothetical protein
LSSRGVDWWRLVDRRCSRWWPTARQRRRLRPNADSGKMRGPAKLCVGVGAQVKAREELWATCGPRAWAEHGSHRWRQWRAAADGDELLAHTRRKEGGYRRGHAGKGGSTTTNGHKGHGMVCEAVGDVRTAGGQWRKAVRAPVCARRPRGTSPEGRCASPTLGAQCPRRTASDLRLFRRLGVRACPYGGETDAARRGATSRVTRTLAPNCSKCPCLTRFFSKFCNWNVRSAN